MRNKKEDSRNGGAKIATEGLAQNVHAVSAALLLLLTPTESRGDDFGDTFAGSTAITAGSTTGVLDWETDQDWFKFEVTVPGLHTIYTTGSTDTLGALYRSSGEEISSGISHNDRGSEGDFEYDTILGVGTYHLKVKTGGSGNLTGAYSLEIRHPQRAKSLQLANTSDQLEVIGDHDFYRIQVFEAGRHWFSTVGKVDTFGALFSEAGQKLISGVPGDERGEGNNFRFSVKLNPGTYFLRINSGDRGVRTGTYTISWRHKGNAIPFSGPNRESSLGVLGDLYYYQIHLLQNSSYRLYSPGGTDTFATLYDGAGNELISGVPGNDRGAGRNFLIESRSQAGTYYLMVEDGGGGNLTGNYGLHLRDRARSIPLLKSGTSQHEISLAGEIDLYSFASPGGTARFESTGLTDTYAELLTQSGERLAGGVSSQDRGEQKNFAFETTLPAGNFLLLVRGQDRSLDVGAYGLIASFLSGPITRLAAAGITVTSESSSSLTVNSSENWTLSGLPGWITASRTSGNRSGEVRLTYRRNLSGQPRQATLTIGGQSYQVTQRAERDLTDAVMPGEMSIDLGILISVQTAAGTSYRMETSTDMEKWTDTGLTFIGDESKQSFIFESGHGRSFFRAVPR